MIWACPLQTRLSLAVVELPQAQAGHAERVGKRLVGKNSKLKAFGICYLEHLVILGRTFFGGSLSSLNTSFFLGTAIPYDGCLEAYCANSNKFAINDMDAVHAVHAGMR